MEMKQYAALALRVDPLMRPHAVTDGGAYSGEVTPEVRARVAWLAKVEAGEARSFRRYLDETCGHGAGNSLSLTLKKGGMSLRTMRRLSHAFGLHLGYWVIDDYGQLVDVARGLRAVRYVKRKGGNR